MRPLSILWYAFLWAIATWKFWLWMFYISDPRKLEFIWLWLLVSIYASDRFSRALKGEQ